MKSNNKRYAVYIIIFAVIVLLIDSVFLVRKIIISSRSVEVTAVIEEVVAVKRRKKKSLAERTVYVGYEYEGSEYHDIKLKVRKNYTIDEEITIYVDTKKPTDITVSKIPVTEVGFAVAAALTAGIGYAALRKEKKEFEADDNNRLKYYKS